MKQKVKEHGLNTHVKSINNQNENAIHGKKKLRRATGRGRGVGKYFLKEKGEKSPKTRNNPRLRLPSCIPPNYNNNKTGIGEKPLAGTIPLIFIGREEFLYMINFPPLHFRPSKNGSFFRASQLIGRGYNSSRPPREVSGISCSCRDVLVK